MIGRRILKGSLGPVLVLFCLRWVLLVGGTGSASRSGSGSRSGGTRSLVKYLAQVPEEMQIHEDKAESADLDGIASTRSVCTLPGPSGRGLDSRSRTNLSVSDRPALGGMDRNTAIATSATGTGTGSSTRSKRSHSSTTSFSLTLSHSNSNSVSGLVSLMDPLSPPPVSPTTEKNMKKKRRDTKGSLHPRSPSRSRSKSQMGSYVIKDGVDEVLPCLLSLSLPFCRLNRCRHRTKTGNTNGNGDGSGVNGEEAKQEGSSPSTGFSSRSRSRSALGSAMGALILARQGDEFEGY
ncbi:hypothetical protein BDQ17DRAFT_1422391 [Cyathus striatus]|nr:hypothetical protein BDQ17DRAFT_1422391 [Cyathus striatus]